jgi:hypothetical protein
VFQSKWSRAEFPNRRYQLYPLQFFFLQSVTIVTNCQFENAKGGVWDAQRLEQRVASKCQGLMNLEKLIVDCRKYVEKMKKKIRRKKKNQLAFRGGEGSISVLTPIK